MSTMSIRLPESLHHKLAELAKSEGVSLNQLVCAAAGEKIAALMTDDYLRRRAARSSDARFSKVLDKIAEHPSAAALLPGDEIRPRRGRSGARR
jgi:hypothetical protein